jgi:hypothetical protein
MCQRYYYRTDELKSVSTSAGRVVLPPSPVPLRATPTITTGNISRIEDGVDVITTPAYSGISSNGSAWTSSTAAGAGVGVKIINPVTYSAEL